MTRSATLALLLTLCAVPGHAQGLRDKISQLFIFGEGESALFLAGTADPGNPQNIQIHGDHFIPASVQSNGSIIAFLESSIASQLSNLPFSSTSGGRTFRFEGGVPIATSTSPGPIFAERALTLVDAVQLTFTHENTDFPNCDQVVGGDCSLMGVPVLENDVIVLDLGMDLNVTSTLFTMSYGLLDWIDIGVAVPIVSNSLQATSQAEVVPFGSDPAHFFSGTLDNPGLTAERFVQGTATGLGDVAARAKIRVARNDQTAFAILGDARFATGSEEDLLGSGEFAIRGLGIVSAQFGAFSPHANVGYLYRAGDMQTDAFLATVGFDHLLADWAALAVDVISEFQVGESKIAVPEPVTIDAPFNRTVTTTNIPDMRDDILAGSFGFKFLTPSGVTIVANSLWPLNDGGIRASVAWTLGLEYNF